MTNALESIPVTILCGPLGSGKTTFLNQLINYFKDEKLVVIENEFGDSGIDEEFVSKNDSTFWELNAGCICCSVKGDLLRFMYELDQKSPDVTRVLIECTGLADPGPVMESFMGDSPLKKKYRLDNVITLVDGVHFPRQKEDPDLKDNEWLKQILFASELIINKTDLIDKKTIKKIEQQITQWNSEAKIFQSQFGKIDYAQLFGRPRSWSLHLCEGHDHHHSAIEQLTVKVQEPLDPISFEIFLNFTSMQYGDRLLRSKGILSLQGQEQKVGFQGVYQTFEFKFLGPWKGPRESRLVFIGKGLKKDIIERGVLNCRQKDKK